MSHPGSWRRQADRVYIATRYDGEPLRVSYFPREPLPVGLSLTLQQVVHAGRVTYEAASLTHDESGASLRGFGGVTDAGPCRAPWRVGEPVAELREWVAERDLASVDWTRTLRELRDDEAAMALVRS